MSQSLTDALLAVDQELERASNVLGATPKSPSERLQRTIEFLKTHICPHKEQIMKISKSKGVEVSVLVMELLVFFLGSPPGLILIAKAISEIGLDKFCEDPLGTLGVKVDVS